MAHNATPVDRLDILSVEVVTQVLYFLDRPSLLKTSHVARRLRDIVHKHELPYNLRTDVVDNEDATNLWLDYLRSLLERDSHISLVFNVQSTSDGQMHLRRLGRWKKLLNTIHDLVILTLDPGCGRIVALVAQLPQSFAQLLFTGFEYPFTHLRELSIHGQREYQPDYDSVFWFRRYNRWQDVAELVSIPSNIFANSTPTIRSLTLRNAILSDSGIPAFAATTSLSCDVLSSTELQLCLKALTNLHTLSLDVVHEGQLDEDWQSGAIPDMQDASNLTHVRLGSIGGHRVDLSTAEVLGCILAKALTNVPHLVLGIDPHWQFDYDRPASLGTFAAFFLPAKSTISVEVEDRDGLHVLITANYTSRNTQPCSIVLDFPFISQGDTADFLIEFFERLTDGSTIAEFSLSFQDVRVAALGLPRRVLETLKKFSLSFDETQLRQEAATDTRTDNDTVWAWTSEMEKDDIWFCEELEGSQSGRNLAPPPDAELLQLNIQTKTKSSCPVELPDGFVDILLLYIGFDRPTNLVLGGGLTIREMNRYSA